MVDEHLPNQKDQRSFFQKLLYCCSDDINQKDPDLNLERPEIIKLSVIKPYEHVLIKNACSQVSINSTPITNTTPKAVSSIRKMFSPISIKKPVITTSVGSFDEIVIPSHLSSSDELNAAMILASIAEVRTDPEPDSIQELSVGERIAQLEQNAGDSSV